jgi:hypothetical protein
LIDETVGGFFQGGQGGLKLRGERRRAVFEGDADRAEGSGGLGERGDEGAAVGAEAVAVAFEEGGEAVGLAAVEPDDGREVCSCSGEKS